MVNILQRLFYKSKSKTVVQSNILLLDEVIQYKHHEIRVIAETEQNNYNELYYFRINVKWSVGDKGAYIITDIDNIERMTKTFIEAAKKHIDFIISQDDIIAEMKTKLNNAI